jgi:hypothetical protein
MKTNPRAGIFLMMFAILLSAFSMSAAETAKVSDLASRWHGKSRFTGISNEEATQKKTAPQDVEIELCISADGKATGRIGGAQLTNCVVAINRGWFGRLFHLWSDFVIRGEIVGPVAPGSESGTHPMSAPFNYDGTQISGSVFVVYPGRYPYPFASLGLNREP